MISLLRKFFVSAFAVFLFSFFPSPALAFDVGVDLLPNGSYWGGMTDSVNYGSFVRANNKYDAAVYSLGLSVPESVPVEVRSKLSDPNYGGRFYQYAQTFYNVQGWPNMPEWLPSYAMAFVGLGASFDRIYASNASVNLRTGADIDFRVIVGGGDVGGGGGSGSVVDLHGFGSVLMDAWDNTDTNWANANSTNAINCDIVDGYIVPTGGTTKCNGYRGASGYCANAVIYYDSAVAELVNRLLSDGYKVILATGHIFYSTNLQKSYGTLNGARTDIISSSTTLFDVRVPTLDDRYYDGRLLMIYGSIGTTSTISSRQAVNQWSSSVITSPLSVPGPDGGWPEPESPVVPTAPELPDPVTPTVTPEPTVTEPTPTWPVIPTPTAPTVTLTDTPSGLDYTQLLTLINDNLNDINSYIVAINSNFNSLRSDLVTEFDSVVQGLRNIYSYLQHMDSVLERHCVHLQNKLEDVSVDIQNKIREMVRWLADQLDFDSESSGNSDLFGILSTINDKLGGGTYEPNPIRDEQGYYHWLDDLWDRFLLGDDWESSVSGISSSFGQLKTRFPFSVPWDIVALFRLFVHDPVTPEFDLPLYFSPDSSTPVHVDLSAWDDVASIVRPLVYVIFALKLALLSRDLLGGLGADKGGL